MIGTFDILFAIICWYLRAHVAPSRIFQSVAAGLYGKASFTGGARTALVGAALHYFIALSIVLVYWVISRRLRSLTRRPILYGALYGIAVYVVMNYVVIPLSATNRPAFLFLWVALSVLVHAFLIGVPAALTSSMAERSHPYITSPAEISSLRGKLHG